MLLFFAIYALYAIASYPITVFGYTYMLMEESRKREATLISTLITLLTWGTLAYRLCNWQKGTIEAIFRDSIIIIVTTIIIPIIAKSLLPRPATEPTTITALPGKSNAIKWFATFSPFIPYALPGLIILLIQSKNAEHPNHRKLLITGTITCGLQSAIPTILTIATLAIIDARS